MLTDIAAKLQLTGILLVMLLLALTRQGFAQPDSSFTSEFETASTDDYLRSAIRNAEAEADRLLLARAARRAGDAVLSTALNRDAKFQLVIESLERNRGFPAFVGTQDCILEHLSLTIRKSTARGWARPQPDSADDAMRLLIVLDDTAFCVFQRRLAAPDTAFAARYPAVLAAIRKGRLKRMFIRRASTVPATPAASSTTYPPLLDGAQELWARLDRQEAANLLEQSNEAHAIMGQREYIATQKRDAQVQLTLEGIETTGNLALAARNNPLLQPYPDGDETRLERGTYFIAKGASRKSAYMLPIDCPKCTFQSRIDSSNAGIAKYFPRTARAIRSGELGLIYLDQVRSNMIVRPMLDFPPFYTPSSLDPDKLHALANLYMNFIRGECEPSGCFDKSLFERYYALEKKMGLSDEVPEQQILARQKFIAMLRSTKCKP